MSKRIAIQGGSGSFHEIAARKYYGKQAKGLIYYQTFIDVFQALEDREVDCALVAIGNNRYGDINHVYDILISNHLTNSDWKYWISGEVYIDINHCLIGLPQSSIKDIKEVHSQAPAIVQCFSYIQNELNGAIAIEEDDTALSAKLISEWQDVSKAAIASEEAAKIHGLKVLSKGIQSDKNNITRFLVIEPNEVTRVKNAGRTSLLLRTNHKLGALSQAIGLFADNKINLSYLQSIPIPNRPFEYRFYIDIDAGLNEDRVGSVLSALDARGCEYDILGTYKRAQLPKVR